MSRRRVVPLLVLVLAVAAAVAFVLLRRPTAAPPPPIVEPAWTVAPPPDAPAGSPFVLGRAPRPETVRWRGIFSYDQAPWGNFGKEPAKLRRSLQGTFAVVEETTGPASARATVVEGTFGLGDAASSPPPSENRTFRVRLAFTRDPDGAVVHRSIRLDAPADLSAPLELFQAAFVQRFAPPAPAVRVGERIPIDDAIDVDDLLKRPLLFLFKERAAISGPVNAPVEGGVWIASKGEDAGGGNAVMKVALTHAYAGENGPKNARTVTIDYRAKLDGERTFALVDGRVTRHALSIARRMRYQAPDFDYMIVVRSAIEMAEDGPSK